MNKKDTQLNAIKRHLIKYKSITAWQAVKLFGALRLSGAIYKLKNTYNWKIKTEDVVVKNRFGGKCNIAKYVLVKKGY